MIKFKATKEQIKQIAVLACNASTPMGLGRLHYIDNQKFTSDDFVIEDNTFCIDYFHGRMVKLWIYHKEEYWSVREDLTPDYQSWCVTYPTWQHIFDTVGGIEVIHEESFTENF